MKNLENIPKNHPFKVPDGYFEELPLIIQSRVSEKTPSKAPAGYMSFAFRYALPAVVIVLVAFFVFRPSASQDAEEILASVDTEALVTYLANSDMTMDEIIDEIQFDQASVEAIEDEVYFNFEDLNLEDIYLDEIDLDSSNNL